MTAHRLAYDLQKIPLSFDPGDAGSIDAKGRSMIRYELVSAGAETRTLKDPTASGQMLTLCMKTDGGDITLTVSTAYDQAGSTGITFNDEGDYVTFVSINDAGTLAWRVLGYDGITGPTTEIAVVDIDTLTVSGVSTFGGATTGLRTEIVNDGTTVVLTTAQSGAVIRMDSAAACAITLPNPSTANIGLTYHFVVSVTTDSATTITIASGNFVGGVVLHDIDTAALEVVYIANGSSDNVLTLNGTTMGGVAGSWFDVYCISATLYLIKGHLMNSGDDTDPFS